MGKFKVGDRVRRIRYLNSEEMKIGDTGTVTEVDAEGDCRVKPDKGGDDQFNFARYLELVTAAPAVWQPKVGDRVVSDDGDTRGEVGTVVEDGVSHYSGLTMVKFDTWRKGHDGVNLYGNTGNDHWLISTEDLRPAPVAAAVVTTSAPLTITAGGYYKTRDGRKVGPAFIGGDVATFGTSDNWSSAVWANDGRQSSRTDKTTELANDIIAEWVDEPAVALAKFKVGDIVKFRDDYGSSARGKRATVINVFSWGIQVNLGGDNGISTESPDDLVLFSTILPKRKPTAIVALIENGQPKPATRPCVHIDQATAAAEASRLALKHPGQEFGVFVLADSKIADTVTETVTRSVLRAA
jgi:hypothetical protein